MRMPLTPRLSESGDDPSSKAETGSGKVETDPFLPQVLPKYCVVAPSKNENVEDAVTSVRSQDERLPGQGSAVWLTCRRAPDAQEIS